MSSSAESLRWVRLRPLLALALLPPLLLPVTWLRVALLLEVLLLLGLLELLVRRLPRAPVLLPQERLAQEQQLQEGLLLGLRAQEAQQQVQRQQTLASQEAQLRMLGLRQR
jgi:hypothetical protein